MSPVRLLGDAVADAQKANTAMRTEMIRYGVRTWVHLHHLIVWPLELETTYKAWMACMGEVVTILAAGEGIEDVRRLPKGDMFRLTDLAYDRVLGTQAIL